jgi:hypothetical protein
MKLRLRLDKISKVVDISDEISEDLTVDELSERALNVFQDCLYGYTEFVFLKLFKFG